MPTSAEVVLSAVPAATCSRWLSRIDAAYRANDIDPSSDFVRESSSFRLRGVRDLSALDVWSALSRETRARSTELLGQRLAIDLDQCWVRRQYPPRCAPARHHPHSWHQDGALGFDFGRHSDSASEGHALLRMLTCWIALTPCGVDAPGLEFVTDRVDRVLPLAQLLDEVVNLRSPSSRRTRPVLRAGDAMLFGGGVLHRTHATTAMSLTRTSIELRCFQADAIPDRLAHDEFVSVSGEIGLRRL